MLASYLLILFIEKTRTVMKTIAGPQRKDRRLSSKKALPKDRLLGLPDIACLWSLCNIALTATKRTLQCDYQIFVSQHLSFVYDIIWKVSLCNAERFIALLVFDCINLACLQSSLWTFLKDMKFSVDISRSWQIIHDRYMHYTFGPGLASSSYYIHRVNTS